MGLNATRGFGASCFVVIRLAWRSAPECFMFFLQNVFGNMFIVDYFDLFVCVHLFGT